MAGGKTGKTISLRLVVDASGNIRGSLPRKLEAATGPGAPTQAGIQPGPGRTLVDVAVSATQKALSFDDLQKAHRVSLRGTPRLVRAKPAVRETPAEPKKPAARATKPEQ